MHSKRSKWVRVGERKRERERERREKERERESPLKVLPVFVSIFKEGSGDSRCRHRRASKQASEIIKT